MLNLLAWAVAGLIIGAIARLLIPGRQPMGCFMTMILGIVGALVGGAIAWMLWGYPGEPFSLYAWPGYLLAIIGAVIVLGLSTASTRPPLD
jgi:uncharacterized membrane protein YeaQ/YmgE (transglycosylase-associated protein family)